MLGSYIFLREIDLKILSFAKEQEVCCEMVDFVYSRLEEHAFRIKYLASTSFWI